MRDQYFGDHRDYFKFDLAIELATEIPNSPRLTYVAMLTPDSAPGGEEDGQGGATNYPVGEGRPELHYFLRRHARQPMGRRRVVNLRGFFENNHPEIDYDPHGDAHPEEYRGREAKDYFGGVIQRWLEDAVILVDPNVGLTPRTGSATSDHHIPPIELVRLKNRMGSSSALMLFQWRGRGRSWRAVFDAAQASLRPWGHTAGFDAVYTGQVAFICIARDSARQEKVAAVLRAYARKHNLAVASR